MKVQTFRRGALAALAAAVLAGTTACSAINDQATTMVYSPSDGVQTNVGDLEVRNLAIISNEPNAEGRFIGTLASASGQALTATITINNETFTFNVPGDEPLQLEDEQNETIVTNTGSEPGLLVPTQVTTGGETEDLPVSVLSGTLPEYRDFAPQEIDDEEQVSHLYEFEGQFAPDNDH